MFPQLRVQQVTSHQHGCSQLNASWILKSVAEACFGVMEGNRRTPRQPIWTWGEHVKLHTDSNLSSELNQGPWSCEACPTSVITP
ncbi:hypothetical protein PGIGA_G00253690 [Pangasianodon gigas]|uniref:Uncharacterized protein n=1 Tax=Pangasianodon gigas TaxID=30993 RepID=A0ACC5WRB3_PANGG|nr:hypothetical protein [Pangasianodon gigas]